MKSVCFFWSGQRRESPEPVFADLQAMLKQLPAPSSIGTAVDFYRMEKLAAVQEILRMHERLGPRA